MKQKPKEILGYIINGLTIIIYFALLFILDIPPALRILQYMGWILLVGGVVFILLSILSLLRKNPDSVIISGVFGMVRHPMYLGSILIYLAMALFLPHWIMITLSIINVIYIYWFMVWEEKENIEKFGDDYDRYLESIPRTNFMTGITRKINKKARREI